MPVVKREGRGCEVHSGCTGEGGPGPCRVEHPEKRRQGVGERDSRTGGEALVDGMWGPSKSWAKGEMGGSAVRRGEQRGGATTASAGCILRRRALGSRMGNVYTRRGYNFREAAQVGPLLCWILGWAASVGQGEAIYQQKNRARKGPKGKREPEGARAGWKEEDDGNITNVNKWPNLGGRSTTVHGPSMARGACAGSGTAPAAANNIARSTPTPAPDDLPLVLHQPEIPNKCMLPTLNPKPECSYTGCLSLFRKVPGSYRTVYGTDLTDTDRKLWV
ncbi:hypothetical protein B0H13DRAFT_1887767 [Mycena leptocephala]|nr:hypothetical protein B0H13DRAFT_1887767 [Mycena leptocephala]